MGRVKHNLIYFVSMLAVALFSAAAQANLLSNPSFEQGTSMPVSWSTYGSGSYIYRNDYSHTGSKCMEVGGSSFALMYQRVAGSAGQAYQAKTWAKKASGGGIGTLKLEFHDAGVNKIVEYHLQFTANDSWQQYAVTNTAPAGTAYVTASIVGEAGGTVFFDDVEIPETVSPDTVTFDISDTSHEFLGFGAQIWGYGPDSNYPSLFVYRQKALEELNIKYVRIENYAEHASWADMQATRAITDALGIKWVYLIWGAPSAYTDGNGMLNDIPGFATWWKNHVADLYNYSIPVEYIELMNEPDSGGAWSTGITYSDYNLLVKDLRAKLDNAGYLNVGIAGAGPADIWKCDDYINAMDSNGVAAMGAWSTHSWGSADGPESESRCITNLKIPANAKDAALPKFVTEYATHETNFHSIVTDPGDDYGIWDIAQVFPYYATMNRQPYAVRCYENTLGLLNGGAQAPFIWQAIDEPTEVNPPGYSGSKRKAWGLLDLWGNPKPVYGALKTLYPKIPVGSKVVNPPSQAANITYAGTYIYHNRIVVGITNELSSEHGISITLTNAPEDLRIAEALGFEPLYWGNTANGDPDIGQEVIRSLTLNTISPTSYSIDANLPGDSTLTIVLTVRADLDTDGDVNFDDLLIMVNDWLQNASIADIAPADGDGIVNFRDFATLAENWLKL